MIELGSLIMQGSKIIRFEDPDYKLKFIDSLSFLDMRLCAMPKELGFRDQTKGYFPHGFGSEKHLNYIGLHNNVTQRDAASFKEVIWHHGYDRADCQITKPITCKKESDQG